MGVSERKLRDLEKIRLQIIEQSWLIVQEEGWQALSIRKIADAIEYSVPVIYKHFENKDAIVAYFTNSRFFFACNTTCICCRFKQNRRPELVSSSDILLEIRIRK